MRDQESLIVLTLNVVSVSSPLLHFASIHGYQDDMPQCAPHDTHFQSNEADKV